MKLFIFAIILSVISLCLSFDRFAEDRFSVLNTHYYQLSLQKYRIETQILDALNKCNETFNVPFKESLELFQNAPFGIMRFSDKPSKCLMDCIMRTMGVVTDNGFDADKYMIQIKQLKYNYTSYDVNKLPDKEDILTTITEFGQSYHSYAIIKAYEFAAYECRKAGSFDFNDNCESSFNVARCVINRCREEGMNNPFYPLFRVTPWRRGN